MKCRSTMFYYFFYALCSLKLIIANKYSSKETERACFKEYPLEYNEHKCTAYWKCTVNAILTSWQEEKIHRRILYNMSTEQIQQIGHTPIWFRIFNKKLYCVKYREKTKTGYVFPKLRLKLYRAMHYINRINRILRENGNIPDYTEWWSHQSDWVKVPENLDFPPVFSTAGAKGYADIPGIPFMSFSDKKEIGETVEFDRVWNKNENNFSRSWAKRRSSAFFYGALSDCGLAISKLSGDIKQCARAKTIFYAAKSQNSMLLDIKSSTPRKDPLTRELKGMSECITCFTRQGGSKLFVQKLFEHKYLLNFPGAGNWSRRLGVLMKSGGAIFQSESQGYQFYEMGLIPGAHFIPFDPQIGEEGIGNLLSRLEWSSKNDDITKKIAFRAHSFGINCLKEPSIDYFVRKLLTEYSKLLVGEIEEVPIVDLSSCVSAQINHSPSGLCREIINQCVG